MCTSFVKFTDKTYIGMNFDISDRPIQFKMAYRQALLISQDDGTGFKASFGINRAGAFMNLQLVDSIPSAVYKRSSSNIHIFKIFEAVLNNQVTPDTLSVMIGEKHLVNVPNLSVHSLITGPGRGACIIEPGRTRQPITRGDHDFLTLTNFPLADENGALTGVVRGDGAERYQACSAHLSGSSFSVEQGFAALASAAQTAGDWPTQISMIAVPEDERVYFSLKQMFNRRLAFSFADRAICTDRGYAREKQTAISPNGVLLSELLTWQ